MEIPCHVVIHYSRVFVGEYSKAKYIGNRLVAIVWDEVVLLVLLLGYQCCYDYWRYYCIDLLLDGQRILRCSTFYTVSGSFHASFGCGWARIEVLEY